MIIRITYDKCTISENHSYIYCPNNINIKRKNIKSEFVKWERSRETWDTERDKEFFELHKVGDVYCYDLEDNYDIDINADSIPL